MHNDVLALRWGSFVAVGVATILLGLVAIVFADAAGAALIAFVGWLLLLGGAGQLVAGVRVRAWRGGSMGLLVAGLRILVGVLFVAAPAAWATRIALLLALFFLLDGAFRVFLALQARPAAGWGSLLVGGSSALLLGLLVLSDWPGSGAFALGLLFGIHLLLDGWTTLMLALAARAAAG